MKVWSFRPEQALLPDQPPARTLLPDQPPARMLAVRQPMGGGAVGARDMLMGRICLPAPSQLRRETRSARPDARNRSRGKDRPTAFPRPDGLPWAFPLRGLPTQHLRRHSADCVFLGNVTGLKVRLHATCSSVNSALILELSLRFPYTCFSHRRKNSSHFRGEGALGSQWRSLPLRQRHTFHI